MLGFHRTCASDAVLDALGRSLAIIEFDTTGKILAANANFCSVMGYSPDEIIGRHHRMFVSAEHAGSAEYREFWEKLGRGQFDAKEYQRFAKGGREVFIHATYNPIRNARGVVTKVVKIATDTTAEKLRNADLEGKMIAIGRVQAVIEFTTSGEVIFANENFLDLMGYTLDEIKGRHHRIFVETAYAHSAEYTEFWAKLNRGEFIADDIRRVRKGGNPVWLRCSYNPIFDMNGKVMKVVKFANSIEETMLAITELGAGLTSLADNNLEYRLDRPFGPTFDKLRIDYNNSLEQMQSTMIRVADSAESIHTGTQQIAISSDDLSRRTEQQAASLEQTAAALDQITSAVRRSAERATQANAAASAAKADAVRSGQVMNDAVSAMGEIDESSGKISQIIGVIDEIAFQTNLLALNAGVEAARAGDAGRGFAVVAQEVRALAQRSADAAKEIKALIASSSGHVKRGVKLVGDTGEALSAIATRVNEIDALIAQMASSAREQSAGLSEINTAVNQMDQTTQQNAAMVEQSTAAASSLKGEADSMKALMGQFRTGALARGAYGQDGRSDHGEKSQPRSAVRRSPAVSRSTRPRTASAACEEWVEV